MPTDGLLISVRNEDILALYLAHGVYGPTVQVDFNFDPFPEPYIRTLADIGCPRHSDHVFFRCENRLYYGGRIFGESERHPFYLNGNRGFIGKAADAPLAWDETRWKGFAQPGREGRNWQYRPKRCQPFLLRFRDWLGLAGRWVDDHAYYVALGDYRHLLPTTDDVTGLTPMTPGETDRLLSCLIERPDGQIEPPDHRDIEFVEDPLPYKPEYGHTLADVVTLEDLIAVALVNPSQLPDRLRPNNAAVGHHVPITPHRPRYVDRVELGYYTDRLILDGTVPDRLVHLSLDPDGRELGERTRRQDEWLEWLLGSERREIHHYVCVPNTEAGFYDSIRAQSNGHLEVVTLPEVE